MTSVLEKKVSINNGFKSRLWYDKKLVQERYKLPERNIVFNGNIFTFTHESFLLSYYCLRDPRFRKITKVFFRLFRKILKKDPGSPVHLKEAFLELGPTFIKIGQFLSSRPDIIPEEFIGVLSELQDSLPPIPFSEIKPFLEKELRKPLNMIFKSFDEEPIASASIGQVYKGELINGAKIVVKVQRPDLNILFYRDLAIIRCLATFLERYTKIGKGREWVQIIDEIGRTLFEEIDFIQEGKNADHFRRNLKHEERIYIPRVFWHHTTKKVLTIEYVPGIKITDIASLKNKNHNPKELAKILVNAYFKQFFKDGFYHADPHPGNIVVKDDGTIVFYDFGMVGRISENVREELANVLINIVRNDTDALLDTLKELDLLKSGSDLQPLKRVIEKAAYKYYEGTKLNSLNVSDIEDDLKILIDEKPMKLPSKFTYTLRMTGTLEGVCRTLDPDFSLISVTKPYLQNWLKDKLPKSKWFYLKYLFPEENKFVGKIKAYSAVIRSLPRYVNEIEKKNGKHLNETGTNKENINNTEIKKEIREKKFLKAEATKFYLKSKLSYGIIFVFCLVFIGRIMVEKTDPIISLTGFTILIFSVFASFSLAGWAYLKGKVVE
ncbi:MAG: hypothetical protein A3B68_08995 [Candidatus Melainabacteria bacterium RIFCSPHIGHO2_02_FULL_34_12]|nr:MAG: hypothetical protein A3B68_08995 [Candidatus Melainabacteria bacterium RIFCSPHIGHO2_02_FULL_34_12]